MRNSVILNSRAMFWYWYSFGSALKIKSCELSKLSGFLSLWCYSILPWNLNVKTTNFGILLNNYCNWKSLLTSYSISNAFTLILNWYSTTSAAQNPNISGLSWNVRSWPRRKPKCRGTTSWLVSLSTCLVAAFKLNEANWTSETLIRMFNSISDVSD